MFGIIAIPRIFSIKCHLYGGGHERTKTVQTSRTTLLLYKKTDILGGGEVENIYYFKNDFSDIKIIFN